MSWQQIRPLLYPSIAKDEARNLSKLIVGGSAMAGLYGALHDQVTYTLSPEYFHKFKFEQFSYADFGLPVRVFVAEIGFLASWWVGLIVAWVLGRISLVGSEPRLALRTVGKAFGVVLAMGVLGGFLGYLYGTLTLATAPEGWEEWSRHYEIQNLGEFARVGQIHLFGYLGVAVGFLAVAFRLRQLRRKLVAQDGFR